MAVRSQLTSPSPQEHRFKSQAAGDVSPGRAVGLAPFGSLLPACWSCSGWYLKRRSSQTLMSLSRFPPRAHHTVSKYGSAAPGVARCISPAARPRGESEARREGRPTRGPHEGNTQGFTGHRGAAAASGAAANSAFRAGPRTRSVGCTCRAAPLGGGENFNLGKTRGQSARGAGAGGGATGAERRRSHGCGRLGRRRCGVRCAGEGYVCSREQQSTRTRHTRGRLRNTTPRNASARRTRTRHTQRSGVTQRNTPLPETNS